MVVANCMIVKCEEDIIEDWWEWSKDQFDLFMILYNGSKDEAAYGKFLRLIPVGKLWIREKDGVFQCDWRRDFVDAIVSEGLPVDWIYFLAPDLLIVGDPKVHCSEADDQGATTIRYDMQQFYPTASELKAGGRVYDRQRHYVCNWDYDAAMKFSSEICWPESHSEPACHPNPVHCSGSRKFIRHYQFRTKKQIERRLGIRNDVRRRGCRSFSHYGTTKASDYVFKGSILSVIGEGEIPVMDRENTLQRLIVRSRLK